MPTIVCRGCQAPFQGRSRRRFCTHRCALTNGHLALGATKAGQEPSATPSLRDVAWAAGIFEGEGTAYQAHHTTIVQVTQVGGWLPDRMRALFGGASAARKTPAASVQPQYVWRVSGTRARGFLMTIYAFLSPRRQEQTRRALGMVAA